MQEFLGRSLRVPPSKWQRMMATDSTKLVVEGFVEREFPQVILPKIILNCYENKVENLMKMLFEEKWIEKHCGECGK